MTEETVVTSAADDDVEQLKAELERLKTENEALKVPAPHGIGARTAWAIVVALIASVMFTIAVPAVWLNRVVMDTDTWVATMAPLADDPAIQDAVAAATSDALIEALDAQTRLEAVLPAELQQLAPIIASSAEGFVRTQTTTLVRSDKFAEIWSELNRVGHSALIAALTGSRDAAIKYEPGVLTLDVGVLAEMVQAKLVDSGLSFLGKVPVSSINRQIEIFNSPALAQASVALGVMNQLAFFIPLVAILLSAIALILATDRRKVALWLGGGIVVAGLLPLQSIYLSQYYVVNQLQNLGGLPATAAQSAYSIVFAQLIASEQVLAVFGLLIFAGAIVAGPAKWAVAMRQGLSGGIEGVASHLELGRFGEWVAARKGGLRVAGIIVAVVILLILPAPRSLGQVIGLAVGIVIWYLLVELLGAGGGSPAAIAGEDELEAEGDAEALEASDETVGESEQAPEEAPTGSEDEPPPASAV